MGYSISQEQHDKLVRFDREGRRCGMSTGNGGCFTRATVVELHESWYYHLNEGPRSEAEMTFCGRHASPVGYEGVNFRVLSSRKLGPKELGPNARSLYERAISLDT